MASIMHSFVAAFFCEHCGANMIRPGVRAQCATLASNGPCEQQTNMCQQCFLQRANAPRLPALLHPRMTMSLLDSNGSATKRNRYAIVRFPNANAMAPGDLRYLFCIDCALAVGLRDWFVTNARAWQRRHRGQSWHNLIRGREHSSAAQRAMNEALQRAPFIERFLTL